MACSMQARFNRTESPSLHDLAARGCGSSQYSVPVCRVYAVGHHVHLLTEPFACMVQVCSEVSNILERFRTVEYVYAVGSG